MHEVNENDNKDWGHLVGLDPAKKLPASKRPLLVQLRPGESRGAAANRTWREQGTGAQKRRLRQMERAKEKVRGPE